jgi:hypothetical protein
MGSARLACSGGSRRFQESTFETGNARQVVDLWERRRLAGKWTSPSQCYEPAGRGRSQEGTS